IAAGTVELGDAPRATRLFGAAARQQAETGVGMPADIRARTEGGASKARTALGAEAYAAQFGAGEAWSFAEAIAEALGAIAAARGGVVTLPSRPVLTRRECEVLRHVADGRTDREIAAALFIGERTVEWHLTNAFNKLGVNTRAAAVAAALQRNLI
ncbi:MAG TPA: helix-turn-helix transcriptional regulator, partial [Thermomicrobiales bacterium]|nr:helix-turn-helix transcriptional regulator [Thermomicrobiales bacterium]